MIAVERGDYGSYYLWVIHSKVCKRWKSLIEEYFHDINKGIHIVDPTLYCNIMDLLEWTKVPPDPNTVSKFKFIRYKQDSDIDIFL